MKQIHFYEYSNDCAVHSWNAVEYLLSYDYEEIRIDTTQMGFLSWSDRLFDDGYRIFIHESSTESYEIKRNDENERTSRWIRRGHNIFKMWMSGEFMKRGD